jgi:hypothetical protein
MYYWIFQNPYWIYESPYWIFQNPYWNLGKAGDYPLCAYYTLLLHNLEGIIPKRYKALYSQMAV